MQSSGRWISISRWNHGELRSRRHHQWYQRRERRHPRHWRCSHARGVRAWRIHWKRRLAEHKHTTDSSSAHHNFLGPWCEIWLKSYLMQRLFSYILFVFKDYRTHSINRNGKIVRVTALVVIGDVKACLSPLQWRSGQPSLRPLNFCDLILYKNIPMKIHGEYMSLKTIKHKQK